MQKPSDEEYALIFEDNKIGAKIYEDLIRRFGSIKKSNGIDRVLDQAEFIGARKVLDYITIRINRAHGVQEESDLTNE